MKLVCDVFLANSLQKEKGFFCRVLLLSLSFLSVVFIPFLNMAHAEDMTITTYYPSPNGTYDALSVKRLSVGDVNADGSINASDVSASSGYLLVSDKLGIGTATPNATLHIANGSWQAINLGGTVDPSTDQGIRGITWGYRSDGNPYYIIRTQYKNYGSYTYNRLQLNWHTGIEIGAHYQYGGTRFFDNSPGIGGTQIFSVGDGDSDIRAAYDLYVNTAANPLLFSSGWQNFPGGANNRAEISNDTGTYKTLMIIGNKSNDGSTRRVSVWDKLEVNGTAAVSNGLTIGTSSYGNDQGGNIELGNSYGSSTSPYMDFHYGVGSGQDYNVRLWNNGNGLLTLYGRGTVSGRLGTYNYSPDDVPSGWGGGLTTWDVCARASIRYTSSISGGGWDLAEEYESKDTTLKPGEIVSIDNKNDNFVVRTDKPTDAAMLGVVSTRPSVLMGVEWDDPKYGNLPIAIIGRVPVRVMFIEGERIGRGEMFTSSFLPGYAMKVTGAGMVVGKTLQAVDSAFAVNAPVVKSLSSIKWPDDDGSNKAKPVFRVPVSSLAPAEKEALAFYYPGYKGKYIYAGKIMLFVGVYYFGPDAASLEKRIEALEKKLK